MSKTAIHFHDLENTKAISKLKAFGEQLTEAHNLIQAITESEVNELSLAKTDAWVQSKTGFQNIQPALNLMGKLPQYKRLLEIYQKTNFNEENHQYDGNCYITKDSALERLKEAYTVYLEPHLEDNYKNISKAVELLNKCGVNSLKCIVPSNDPLKPYKINPYLLNFIE